MHASLNSPIKISTIQYQSFLKSTALVCINFINVYMESVKGLYSPHCYLGRTSWNLFLSFTSINISIKCILIRAKIGDTFVDNQVSQSLWILHLLKITAYIVWSIQIINKKSHLMIFYSVKFKITKITFNNYDISIYRHWRF